MTSQNQKTTVIRNGTLIDGSGSPPTENEAVVIQENRITSVGRIPPGLNLEDKESVRIIDATGRWIMPGLIDGHCHLSFGQPAMPGVSIGRGTASAEFTTLKAARNAPFFAVHFRLATPSAFPLISPPHHPCLPAGCWPVGPDAPAGAGLA